MIELINPYKQHNPPFVPKPKILNVLGLSKKAEKILRAKDKRQLSWSEAQKKYPGVNPFADTDKDGVPNFLDCRPFNKKRQDMPSQAMQMQMLDPPENLQMQRRLEEEARLKKWMRPPLK